MLSTALSPGATLRFRWSSTSPDSPRRHCGAGRSPSKPPGHRRRQVRKQRPPPRAARFGAQLAAKTAEQAHGGLGATSRTRGDQPSPAPPVRSVCENTIPPPQSLFPFPSFAAGSHPNRSRWNLRASCKFKSSAAPRHPPRPEHTCLSTPSTQKGQLGGREALLFHFPV